MGTYIKMAALNPTVSTVTLNGKWYKHSNWKSVSNWIKTTKIKTNQQEQNKDPTQTIGYLQGIYFKY